MFTSVINNWNLLLFEIGIVILIITLKLRTKFLTRVNCWFCNTNTRVRYELKNSWTCPQCEQYNGFTPDGDYNQDIPAQYCTKLNKTVKRHNVKSSESSILSATGDTSSNGLCNSCNRNQELKIHQLAMFIPKSEKTYSAEVEAFGKHLDEAYVLCKDCESVVKRQLTRVKRRILGLLNKPLTPTSKKEMDSTPTKVMRCNMLIYITIALAILNVIETYQRSSRFQALIMATDFWSNYTESITNYFAAIFDFVVIFANYIKSQFCITAMTSWTTIGTYFFSSLSQSSILSSEFAFGHIHIEHFAIQLMGIAISVWILYQSDPWNQNKSITMLLTWSACLSMGFLEEETISTDIFFIILSTATVVASLYHLNMDSKSFRGDVNKSFHRIYSDFSESEDLDDSDSIDIHSKDVLPSLSEKYPMRKFMSTTLPLNSSSPMNKSHESIDDTFCTIRSSSPIHNFEKNHRSRNSIYYSPGSLRITRDPHKFGECNLRSAESFENLSLFSEPLQHSFGEQNQHVKIKYWPNNLKNEEVYSGIRKLRLNDTNNSESSQPVLLSRKSNRYMQQPDCTLSDAMKRPYYLGTQNSWVAGGFWSGAPQVMSYNCNHILNRVNIKDNFHPIESRSSSQSSGFESRPNSAHDITRTHNSRESSVSGDDEIRTAFSEPLSLKNCKDNGLSINQPRPVFPITSNITKSVIHPSKFNKDK